MKRWLPAPILSASLWAIWLLLNNTLAPPQVVLGALLALAIPLYAGRLWPERPRPRRPGVALRLLLRVLRDIVLSNLEVARRVLGPEARLRPGFVWLPLSVRDPYAIATLAGIISLTPGTLSAELSPDRRHLLIHALHLEHPEALVADIKARYEAPLLEIFP
jgi:multicomponent K+:H+ antiporter subunit E